MKNSKIINGIVLVFLLIINTFVYAIPANPHPIVFTQPDGEELTVILKGDERIHWSESMDGYTLLYNKEGFLTYAQLDEYGNLQPSEFVATDIENRNIAVLSFLSSIEKNLYYSEVQQQIMLKVWEIEDEVLERGDRAVKGHYKTLCAFTQFPEKPMIKTLNEFEPLFNQLGYTGNGKGSVRDFFRESSYGQFELTITLCGIYTAPNSSAYYAGDDGTENCQELARWLAQQVAAEPHINFADYDSDNNGEVDGFHFVFAGRGQEAGGGKNSIWSHKWQFGPPVSKNGKKIEVYSCSPELRSVSAINTIGVVCHEMTHAFGAPDFYDTNGAAGGSYTGTGDWDIMASGSWNGSPNGNSPAHHNMYTKVQFGWVTPIILNSPITIVDMPNSAENPIAFRVNTTTNNERYLMDNRRKIKFDTSIPGDGLLIYHVHSNVNYGINNTHPQRMYPVCASRTTQMPTNTPTSYGSINTSGCTFPYSDKNAFTDETTPAMWSWANNHTEKPVTNITKANGLVSFDFMGGGEINYVVSATATNGGTLSPAGAFLAPKGSSQSFTFSANSGYFIYKVLINGVEDPDAAQKGTYTFSNISDVCTIQVFFSIPYEVVFPEEEGVTFEPYGNSTSPVEEGGKFEFTVTLDEAYIPFSTIEIKANDIVIIPEEDIYTINNITEDQIITISGLSISIKETEWKDVNVFSHSNSIYINNNGNVALKSAEIIDIMGRTVHNEIIKSSNTTISLQVAEGIYFIRLISQDENILVKKVVIHK